MEKSWEKWSIGG